MKRILVYIIIGVLPLAISAQSSDHDAMEKAFVEILKSDKNLDALAVDSLANMLSLKSKKDPDVQVRLARSYYRAHNRKKANEFIERAFEAHKDYSRAYVLQGDIALADYDSTEAVKFYEKAIAAEPRDTLGYRKLCDVVADSETPSMTTANLAISKLEQLKTLRPDVPVDLMMASVWRKFGTTLDNAIVAYARSKQKDMGETDLVYYATLLMSQRKYSESLQVVEANTSRFPNSFRFNRLMFYNQVELQQFQKAVKNGEELIKKGDAANKLLYMDYNYLARAYAGIDNEIHAVEILTDVINRDTLFTQDDVERASTSITNLVDRNKELVEYDKAAALYYHYISNKRNANGYNYFTYAEIFREKLAKACYSREDTLQAYQQYSDALTYYEEHYPTDVNIPGAYYRHATYCSNILDPETEQGLAKPLYEKLAQVATTLNDPERSYYLKVAYHYLGYYYFLKKDYAMSRPYWRQLLAIDPNYETAKTALRIMK